jgi:hypothetical protein
LENKVSIGQFIQAIKHLPMDQPREDSRVWYKTQKEHWLGWLSGYDGPGAYGREPGQNRDACFAYNHVVNPLLLLYLIRAIPVRPELVEAAETAYLNGSSMMEKSGAIRKIVPWSEVYQAIWGKEKQFVR